MKNGGWIMTLMLKSARYQNKVRVFGGHLADAFAVCVWEQTCLIEMAMLVAPSAIMPDLLAESGFEPVTFLSLPRHFDLGRGLIVPLGHVQGPSRRPFQH